MDIDELIMAFEDEFGCRIPDRDAADFHTVGDAIAYLGQISRRSAERFEDGDGGEGQAGDDRRRAEQIPDVFRDFRLAFHHTTCVKQCPAVLGHENGSE